MPPRDKFSYTFDNLAKVIDEFTAKLDLTKYAAARRHHGDAQDYARPALPLSPSLQRTSP
jgi:hypothetical protein